VLRDDGRVCRLSAAGNIAGAGGDMNADQQAWGDFADAVALAQDQPGVTFLALDRLVQATIGTRLFTVMSVDMQRSVARRVYSGRPDVYPVLGEKPLTANRWTGIVLDRHQTFAANTIHDIAEVFPDHALILSLGCESCLNLPIVIAGRLWGTLNCLDVAGHYTPDRIATAQTLRPAGALAFLLAEAHQFPGENNG
jgi:GAF domain-containing protein